MVPRRAFRYALVIAAAAFVADAQLGLGPPDSVPDGIPQTEGPVRWWASSATEEPGLYRTLVPKDWDPDAVWAGEGTATVWMEIPQRGRLSATVPIELRSPLNTRNLDELRGPLRLNLKEAIWTPSSLHAELPVAPLGDGDWLDLGLVVGNLGTAPRRVDADAEGSVWLDLGGAEERSSGEGRLRVVRVHPELFALSSVGGIGLGLEDFLGPELCGVWQQWQGDGGVPELSISFELRLLPG